MKQSPLNAIQLLWVNLIMDSLAALALATGAPTEALLNRKPQDKNDYLVSRKMVKHIMYNSIWQSIILMIICFYGEFIIPESNIARRHDLVGAQTTIYPGRAKTWVWEGEDPLYNQYDKGTKPYTIDLVKLKIRDTFDFTKQADCEDIGAVWKAVPIEGTKMCYHAEGAPRHFTFFFTTFVMLQVVNMFCSRKIHDEMNPFSGIFSNWVFLAVWFFIFGLQVLITQFTGVVFEVCPDGLTIVQWAISVGLGSTVLFINFLIKFIPDRATPAMGRDRVFDAAEVKAGRAVEAKYADK